MIKKISFILVLIFYILTYVDIALWLNSELIEFLPEYFTIPIDIEDVYLEKIFPHSGLVMSILGSLFIPPFIQMYGLARSENFLLREIVKSSYSYLYVLRIIFCFILYSLNRSDVFKLVLNFHIGLELFFIYKDYFRLNFDRRGPALNMLGKAFEKQRSFFNSFLNTKNSFFKEIRSVYPDFAIDPSMGTYSQSSFSSDHNVNGYTPKKLDIFLENLSVLLSDSVERRASISYNSGVPENDIDTRLHWLIPRYDIASKQIFLELRLSPEVVYEDVKNDIERLSDNFESIFRYRSEQTEVNQSISDYFTYFDVHIFDLIRNNKIRQYQEEIEYMRDFLEDAEKLSRDDNSILFSFLNSLRSFISSQTLEFLNDDHKYDIYLIIKRVFRISLYSNSSRFSSQATDLFLDCIVSFGITKERYERDVTSMISYSKITDESILGYVNCLTTKASAFQGEKALLAFNFLNFLAEDTRDKEYGVFSGENSICLSDLVERSVLILAAQAHENSNVSEGAFYEKVSVKNFFKSLNSAYTNKYGEYEFRLNEERKFDRHGVGGVWSFSRLDFYESFIVDYFKWLLAKKSKIKFNNINQISFALDGLLENVLKVLKQTDVEVSFLHEIVSSMKSAKNHEIINAPLDRTRLEAFVKDCEKEYLKAPKLSEAIGASPVNIKDERDGIGFNVTIPREYYTTKHGVKVINQGQNGRALANGENEIIFKELLADLGSHELEIENLFKDVLPMIFERDDFVFVTNSWDWDYRLFEWSGICKFDQRFRFKVDDDRRKFLSFNNKDILVLEPRLSLEKFGPIFMVYKRTDRFTVHYYKTDLNSEGMFFPSKNVFFTLFEDIGSSEEKIKEIIDSSYFDGDEMTLEEKVENLKLKVGMRQLMKPRLAINDSVDIDSNIKIYKITNYSDE